MHLAANRITKRINILVYQINKIDSNDIKTNTKWECIKVNKGTKRD